MGSERWVPALGYEVVHIADRRLLICRKGQRFVTTATPDEDVVLRPIAETANRDEAMGMLHAMRATLPERPDTPAAELLDDLIDRIRLVPGLRSEEMHRTLVDLRAWATITAPEVLA